jgi:transposase
MLAIGKRPRVYLSRVPTDMRCSFEGLSARARSVIEQNPLSGHLFVFLNRQRDYIKVLYWDLGLYMVDLSTLFLHKPQGNNQVNQLYY